MTDLLSLARRVEEATEADRELMCACYKAVFPEVSAGAWDAIDAWDTGYDRFCAMLDVGASIDAAMTLVPEGWRTGMVSEMVHRDDWHWRLVAKRGHDRYRKAGVNGVARTLALALCSAALRARAAQGEG